MPAVNDIAVAVHHTHEDAEPTVKELQKSGFEARVAQRDHAFAAV
jgi:hypothetical protein